MAVENKYVDANVAADKLGQAAVVNGAQVKTAVVTFEVAAADSDGSIYRLLKNIDPNLIPIGMEVFCDAITAGTDWDLGLYEPLSAGGAVIDKDIFGDGMDLSSAKAFSAAGLFGMKDVDIANLTKKIFEHAGHTITTRKAGYDIALTANTVGSAAGTVTAIFRFIQG